MKKETKVLFIYNPVSGKRQVFKYIDLIKREITKKYGSCDVVESKSKEHFQETINNASRTYDYVFFSGGDGTFNMTLNAIPDIDNLPVYGFLPGGSTSDMSYNLNISKNIKKGLYDLLNANIKEYSYGKIGNKRFIYVADLGCFLDVVHNTPSSIKNKFGRLGYFFYALKYFKETFKRNFRTFDVTIDGAIYKTPFMLISNSKEVAARKINPFYTQDTDNYYLVIVNDGKMHGFANLAYFLINGLEKSVENNKVKLFISDQFTIDTKCTNWDIDGESTVLDFPLVCGYSGKKIKLLSNRD